MTDLHKSLHDWYRQYGRNDLPWRTSQDPYAIWISEIMLQQTQVKTVLERFYFPFLEHFPTLEALAGADLQDVLKAWEGLGYYRRARNLHKAAQQALPALPDTVERLKQLPGIGTNTAHAIAAFAYHLPVPVMEANVRRVLCRFFALKHPTEKILWEKAEALLDRFNPFDYNQAMMDIGALVCTKSKPSCQSCPLASACQGKNNPEAFPVTKTKKATPTRHKDIIVYYNKSGKYLLTRRDGEFLHGLYGFTEQPAHTTPGNAIGQIRQIYSHFTLEANVYLQVNDNSDGEWYSLQDITNLPLSKADQKVVQLLKETTYPCHPGQAASRPCDPGSRKDKSKEAFVV